MSTAPRSTSGPTTRTAGPDPAERARLAALVRYDVLDTAPERAFDDLCQLAAQLCGTPTALVSLVDEGRQWFKARLGLDVCSTDRDVAFCAHALAEVSVLVVPDASTDPRFRDNPLVTGPPGIRFYAGAPLVTDDGFVLGTLCVIDTVPRRLDERQLELLQALARQVMTQLEHRRQAQALALEIAAREVAEASYADTRRLLDGVLEHTDVLVYAKDTDGRFLLANAALHALFGQSRGQIVGHTDAELFGEHEAEAFTVNDRAVAATGTRQVLAETLTHPDGSVHSYLSTKFPLRDDRGEVYAVAGVSTDVTELADARSQLAESEQRWKSLVENSPVAVAVYGVDDLRFRYANDRAAGLYGARTAEELAGRSYLDLHDGTQRPAHLHRLERLLAGESILADEARIVGLDGQVRDVEVNCALVTWNGEPAIQVESRDITARVAADQALRASEDRLRDTTAELVRRQAFSDALLDSVQVGIVACDADGHLTTFNNAARRWHGIDADADLDPAELSRHYDLFAADGVTPLTIEQIPLLVALRTGSVRDVEMVIAPRARPATRVLCTGQVLLDEDGTVRGAVVAMHDITELRADEVLLREHAAFHDAVLAASPDMIYIFDPAAGRNLWSSRNLLDVLGYTPEQVVDLGTSVYATLVHPDDVPRLRASNAAGADLADGEVLKMRYRARGADGAFRWLSRGATPFKRDAAGRVTEMLAIARDVTELVEVEERLTEAALHDALTGLPNRTLLTDRLGLALRRTARTSEEVAILFCDLDGFKGVNDSAGHAAGDAVLKATAERLRGVLRPQDTVARVGGDEFVVVLEAAAHRGRAVGRRSGSTGDAGTLPGSEFDPRAGAVAVADRIKAALAAPVVVDAVAHVVGVSIGITFATAGDDPDEALREADRAMYLAKSHGKNRHEVFGGRRNGGCNEGSGG